MSKRFSSILDELDKPSRNRDLIVENRANQVIASFSHLIKLIEESYDTETANDLKKRLVNSLRTKDEEKFSRKIRSLNKNGECDGNI